MTNDLLDTAAAVDAASPCKACGNPDPEGFACDVCGAELFALPPDPGADVADVPLIEANPAPILAGTAERNAHELNGSLKNVSGLVSGDTVN